MRCPTALISPLKPCRSRNSRARLKPRPSVKLGKAMAIGPALPPDAAMSAASSAVGSSTVAASSGSATSVPVVRSTSTIESLLERRRAHAPPRFEEALSLIAVVDIGVDDGVDGLRHGFGAEAGPDDGADRGAILRVAAKRDLVELGAFLVDAENADIAGMVMTASVDAAGHVEPQLADLFLTRRILEALGDLLGDGDRARVGEVAVVEARAADHVAEQLVVAGGKARFGQRVIERRDVGDGHVREHQILGVVDAHLVVTEPLGEIGDQVHDVLSLIHISEPTRRTPISYAVFCLK